MKKTILGTLVMSLAITGLLAIATTSPANGAACTKKEISTFKDVDMAMASLMFGAYDDGDVFPYIDKAKKATKNKTLKALYLKLESAVEAGGTGYSGKSKEAWRSLQSKIENKRC